CRKVTGAVPEWAALTVDGRLASNRRTQLDHRRNIRQRRNPASPDARRRMVPGLLPQPGGCEGFARIGVGLAVDDLSVSEPPYVGITDLGFYSASLATHSRPVAGHDLI